MRAGKGLAYQRSRNDGYRLVDVRASPGCWLRRVRLPRALKRAIDAANRAQPGAQNPTANMTREEADAIANQIAPEPRPSQARGPRSTPATR